MAEASTPEDPGADADLVTARLLGRFVDFSETCASFSAEIGTAAGAASPSTPEQSLVQNLYVARSILSKWTLAILTLLQSTEWLGFQAIKAALGRISGRILSARLKELERLGLVRRTVVASRPPRVQYALTRKGRTVVRLGEPVFLYLRLTEGFLLHRVPVPEDRPPAAAVPESDAAPA